MSLITTNSWRYLWHESSTRNHSMFYYLNQAHGRRNMSHSPFIKHINAILSFTLHQTHINTILCLQEKRIKKGWLQAVLQTKSETQPRH
jgi:hypothetical protein